MQEMMVAMRVGRCFVLEGLLCKQTGDTNTRDVLFVNNVGELTVEKNLIKIHLVGRNGGRTGRAHVAQGVSRWFWGCTWQGKACQLVVNHEEGFSLYATGTRGVVGNGVSPGSPPTPLWKRSFDKLKMSADDGARLLWLDFGGEDGEFELDLESCPKPIVFVLHNFLSAKIHRMGLSA
ncbi:hypothetical protein HZH68_012696 [Vespula germanica]|uniref:Syntrophin C-terminal PH domain-containing protein n=1 Tax=Vespula germanica TaxID=30212 RepID=A0A834JKM9_VESGE|nr:hypothetical protein HZH68_012696 [Vespula germanica]